MHRLTFRRSPGLPGLLALSLALSACGGAPTPVMTLSQPAGAPAEALTAAAEAYYTADTPDALRAAVEQAKAAGPDRALYHEIAAELARLEDRRTDRFDHLVEALRDPGADNPWMLMQALLAESWSLDQRGRVEALCRALMQNHPDPEIRASAAWMLTGSLHLRGEAGLGAVREDFGWRPPLSVIGTWNNDQGKGFDAERAPERGIDPEARLRGQLVEVSWRDGLPLTARGGLDLKELLSPNDWSMAYLASAFEAPAGAYEIRIATGDPVKVWVDDALVFSNAREGNTFLDSLVLPVQLDAGSHRLLIKSAQRTGEWGVTARITGPGGAPVSAGALKALPLGTAPVANRPVQKPWTLEMLLQARLDKLSAGPARRAFLQTGLARLMGARALAATLAEAFISVQPKSLTGRYLLASTLWDNGERGRTADLITALSEGPGEALIYFRLKQARFWRQQKLHEKARKLLVQVRKAHPDRPSASLALAEQFEDDEWHEDRCRVLREVDARWPAWPRVQLDLADCLEDLRLYPKASILYQALLKTLPNSHTVLSSLHWHAQGNDRYADAQRYALRLTQAWPERPRSWSRLAETRRRLGDLEGARAALDRMRQVDPASDAPWRKLGQLAWQQGDKAAAVEAWRAALVRNPEDEKLAHRLDWLAPEAKGPWADDVPSMETILKAVLARAQITPAPGSDVIYLLDDEVTELRSDGSTVNVVTTVAHAVNEAGRDNLTRIKLRSDGRARILHAFAVDPRGQRIEASSIRGSVIRFRQLGVGSTIVVQYRLDSRPDGYLANHLARQWWFQMQNAQARISRWVLWMPEGSKLSTESLGPVEHTRKVVGDQIRVSWEARDTAPVLAEPYMPPYQEVAAHVVVSTVPDWDTYWKWEEALLTDAFRESPELKAMASTIFKEGQSTKEKVHALQTWLMTEIRYQQDYEGFIAGVKPHAAPQVVARRYGDCKDKAVLFITLARMAGVEAHYALVRTRDAGQVRREVPMQQFNHAIVYVPGQPGFEEGRFFDPTVDALDVDVLRHDDQGTWSLVYDPFKRDHAWRQIPFQAPETDITLVETTLAVQSDGDAQGEMTLKAQGRLGATLRTVGRNPEKLSQLLQRQLGRAYPGGRLVKHEARQLDRVDAPAEVGLTVDAPSLGRVEARTLRLKAPVGWQPEAIFALSERRSPLLIGVPSTTRWTIHMDLPEGARIKRLPEEKEVASECMKLSREVVRGKGRVTLLYNLSTHCERIVPEAYQSHRDVARQMASVLNEDVVVDLGRAPKRKVSSL